MKKIIFNEHSVKDSALPVIALKTYLNRHRPILCAQASWILKFAFIFLLTITRPCMAATILLDAGHGGDDSGATNDNGYLEKQFTLTLAQKTAQLLSTHHQVKMTRQSDVAVSNADRAGMANHLRADLMISLHAATFPYCSDRKAAVYYHDDKQLVFPPGMSTSDPTIDPGTHSLDWDKLQDQHQDQSRQLATLIRKSLLEGGAFDRVIISGAPLLVLMGADLPALMIEVGCMHLSKAGSMPKIEDQIDMYAQSIANAINLAVKSVAPEK
jgi:N-acetylmuramoyl-L-alanine amidase